MDTHEVVCASSPSALLMHPPRQDGEADDQPCAFLPQGSHPTHLVPDEVRVELSARWGYGAGHAKYLERKTIVAVGSIPYPKADTPTGRSHY